MNLHRERRLSSNAVYQEVAGERTAPVIAQALSLQTRFSNYMAFGLIGVVGAALLLWYYTHATKPLKIHAQTQLHAASKTFSDDLALPSIGPVRIPLIMTSATDAPQGTANLDSHYGANLPQQSASATPTAVLRAMSSYPLAGGSSGAPAMS